MVVIVGLGGWRVAAVAMFALGVVTLISIMLTRGELK
jgi:uncharacterized membrane protein YjjP (DUF1212 family)